MYVDRQTGTSIYVHSAYHVDFSYDGLWKVATAPSKHEVNWIFSTSCTNNQDSVWVFKYRLSTAQGVHAVYWNACNRTTGHVPPLLGACSKTETHHWSNSCQGEINTCMHFPCSKGKLSIPNTSKCHPDNEWKQDILTCSWTSMLLPLKYPVHAYMYA